MKLVLVRVGRGRTPWADAAVEDYARRLRRKLDLREVLVKPEPFRGDEDAVRQAEAQRILGQLKGGDRLVALDERGEGPTSAGFARWLQQAAEGSAQRVVFAIGGPYGHGPAVRQRAWKVLALSSMVTNHELARVMLVEQLYRASTLLWGGRYHH